MNATERTWAVKAGKDAENTVYQAVFEALDGFWADRAILPDTIAMDLAIRAGMDARKTVESWIRGDDAS